MEREWKPNVEVSPACPRCGSSNTKFCYYNNYSLTQPRYFCKGCRRYWTKGGSLRNVPIGGGCRKSRRGKYLRASTDGGLGSSTSAHNGIESTSSVSVGPADTSTSIDLAAVYANFLNPTPLPETNKNQGSETLSGDGIVIPSIEFPNFHLASQESTGFFECGPFPGRLPETELLGDGNNSMFLCGIDEGFHQNHEVTTENGLTSLINPMMENAMLPPLPGEYVAAVSEGILWPGSSVGLSNQILPPTTNEMPPGIVESGGQNSQVLNGNVSQFSALHLEAFFRS